MFLSREFLDSGNHETQVIQPRVPAEVNEKLEVKWAYLTCPLLKNPDGLKTRFDFLISKTSDEIRRLGYIFIYFLRGGVWRSWILRNSAYFIFLFAFTPSVDIGYNVLHWALWYLRLGNLPKQITLVKVEFLKSLVKVAVLRPTVHGHVFISSVARKTWLLWP